MSIQMQESVKEIVDKLDVNKIESLIDIINKEEECHDESCYRCYIFNKFRESQLMKDLSNPNLLLALMVGESHPFVLFRLGFYVALCYLESLELERLNG